MSRPSNEPRLVAAFLASKSPACLRESSEPRAAGDWTFMAADLNRNVAIFGIYATPAEAERGVDHLLNAGFTQQDISVLLPDDEGTRTFAYKHQTHAPEGAATGVTAGGLLGGTFGLLAGLGALAIPGVGPFLAAGPIMAALAGAGVGGTLGGVVGALVGAGVPEFVAERYERHVKDGGTLLSVHCDTDVEIDAAEDCLQATGAKHISSDDEQATDEPEAAVI